MNKIQRYLRNRRNRTNIRVMIEISRNYNTFIRVTQLKLTPPQFYNMTEQQRFNLLYDTIGGVEWGEYLWWIVLDITVYLANKTISHWCYFCITI